MILVICLLIVSFRIHKRSRPEGYSRNVLNNYILLKLIIPNDSDMGGFAWHLHMVQSGIWLAERTGKKLYVYFEDGYYYDKSVGPNWWEFFYEQPYSFTPKEIELILYADKKGKTREITSENISDTNRLHLMTNHTFQNVVRNHTIDWSRTYDRIILKSDISNKINNIVDTEFRPKMIGVHYRGTDKFAAYGDKEDIDGGHLLYNKMIQEITKYKGNEDWGIFVASDEQPFVDEMIQTFGNTVITYDSSRSDINTSGLDIGDTIKCTSESTEAQCKKYFDIVKNHSIHRGNNHIPPYKKGLDAIMVIYLLAKCNVMFRNAGGGNFSSQPTRINPKLKLFSYINGKFRRD